MARDICVALGERIRELRLKRGWRQIDFAEETGMHENYVLEFRIIPRRNSSRYHQKTKNEFSPILILSFIHARIIAFKFERSAGHA